MLLAALKKEAPDIVLDLLTQQDLEQLKRSKGAKEDTPIFNANPKQKKYLILTLKGEYEKTHFPLPLTFQEEPDINSLRKTFTRMQELFQMQTSNAFSQLAYEPKRSAVDDFVLIETENQQLRRELESAERVFSQTDTEFFRAAHEQIAATSEFD